MRFWLGGYTADMDGIARGIGVLDVASPTAVTFLGDAVATASPSWIAQHPSLDIVYAALEGVGTVQAFRRVGEQTLAPLGQPVKAGEAVCHLAVAPSGDALIASCFGDGRVVTAPIAGDGSLAAPRLGVMPRDPYAVVTDPSEAEPEQRAPHAHQARFLPGGLIATTDLGHDLVRIWRSDLSLVQEVALPQGTGPRHTAWHQSGHLYVVCELSCEVFVLAPDRTGHWSVLSGTVVSPAQGNPDYPAEISITPGGEFVHVTVRGTNTLATLAVSNGGASLTPVALVEVDADWPRHHLLVGENMLVAGQRSNNVTVLPIDTRTGIAGRVRANIEVPTPTCFLPVRA